MSLILNILTWLSIYAGTYSFLFYVIFKQKKLIDNWLFKVVLSFIVVPVLVVVIAKLDIIHILRKLFGVSLADKVFLPYNAYFSLGKSIVHVVLPKSFLTILQTNKIGGEEVLLLPALIFASVHVYVTSLLTKWLTGRFNLKNLLLLIGISFVAYSFSVTVALFEFKLRFGRSIIEQKVEHTRS